MLQATRQSHGLQPHQRTGADTTSPTRYTLTSPPTTRIPGATSGSPSAKSCRTRTTRCYQPCARRATTGTAECTGMHRCSHIALHPYSLLCHQATLPPESLQAAASSGQLFEPSFWKQYLPAHDHRGSSTTIGAETFFQLVGKRVLCCACTCFLTRRTTGSFVSRRATSTRRVMSFMALCRVSCCAASAGVTSQHLMSSLHIVQCNCMHLRVLLTSQYASTCLSGHELRVLYNCIAKPT